MEFDGSITWTNTTVTSSSTTAYTVYADATDGTWISCTGWVTLEEEATKPHPPEAVARADDLLHSHLTEAQRESLAQHGWFIVIGGKSGRRYRIRKNTLVANIDVLAANDNVEFRLCGHCDPKIIPFGDNLLAQKVMLEVAEDDFLQIANRHAA